MGNLFIVIAITAIAWLIDWSVSNLPIIHSQGIIKWLAQSNTSFLPHPILIGVIAMIALAVVLIFKPDSSSKNQPASLSKDKLHAMHPQIPKEFLSKDPKHLTVGTYGNLPKKYVNIPFFGSPDHMLIIGSPGSQKTTTLLNLLLYNFNFSEENKEDGDKNVVK